VETIRLHLPFLVNQSQQNISEILNSDNWNSGGKFTKSCEDWFYKNYNTDKVFFTSSCTTALEMAALLCDFNKNDEVILPAYTFVSTANAFSRLPITLRFADSGPLNPNISIDTILPLISKNTRLIVVMHYAGIAVDMDPILSFAKENNILVIEDAAQATGSLYNNKLLGTFGDMSGLSFHSTKLISCGEGGCCIINNKALHQRAEILFEKGTNKRAFDKKQISRYEWIDTGSSYTMSEFQAAILISQLEQLSQQITIRNLLWNHYMSYFESKFSEEYFNLPQVPEFAGINGSHFYIVLNDPSKRDNLKTYLQQHQIESAFHFLSLHRSPYYKNVYQQDLKSSDKYEAALLRLPLHSGLNNHQIEYVADRVIAFFKH
jgi:dTDP-4-amino-4,6-dideoxygalactose transaminase